MASTSVSVVIAFYNGSRWIKRALESVQNQTMPPNEVIVVNDGSSEDELGFLVGLQQSFNFQILNQENSGQSAARNLGVSKATSDYICFLDQDDYYRPKHNECLLANADFEDLKFGFSYGDLWRSDEAGRILSHSSVNADIEHPHTSLNTLVGKNMYIVPSATLISRTAFLAVGGFDPKLRGYEDDDLFLRFFLAGYSSKFTPEAVTVWTMNTTSTSFTESMARSRFIYFKKLLNTFPESSVFGNHVFGDLMFQRFAYQFAGDVIESAFKGGENYEERLSRLKEFRSIVRASNEITARGKRKYLFITFPIVKFSKKILRLFLLIILRSGLLSVLARLPSKALREFGGRYLPRKKDL
ncbi:MAG: glycosyltransferase family 2 protein [Rhodoluna sp.]|nr:glycosyltransferase family 2 protein [Rhodoluna sp.]